MVVRLRLQRFGRTHSPFYRMVAADARSPRDGRFLEIVRICIASVTVNLTVVVHSFRIRLLLLVVPVLSTTPVVVLSTET